MEILVTLNLTLAQRMIRLLHQGTMQFAENVLYRPPFSYVPLTNQLRPASWANNSNSSK